MFLGLLFHLILLNSDPLPLVLKSGTILECESYQRVGDWVVVKLAEGFDIKATKNGPRKFKVAAQKVDWDETEIRKPQEMPQAEGGVNVQRKDLDAHHESSAARDAMPEIAPSGNTADEQKSMPASAESRDGSADADSATEMERSVDESIAAQETEVIQGTQTTVAIEEIELANRPAEEIALPTEYPPFREVTVAGLGGKMTELFFLEAGSYIVKMKHHGLSRFGAQIIEQNGKSVILLANEIGDFWGTKAVTIELTSEYHINVQADGEWEVSISKSDE